MTGDAAVTAQWQEIAEPAVYTVTFDGNGAEGAMEPAEADESGSYTLPECGFTAPEGTEFAGWLVRTEDAQAAEPEGASEEEAEGAESVEGETEEEEENANALGEGEVIVLSGDAVLVAQWRSTGAAEEPKVFTIVFDANGGEGEMEAAQPDKNGEYTLPDCGFTAPEGMEFAGWQIGEETCQAGETISVFADMTIPAVWQDPDAVTEEKSVTVTLKVVNGAWDDGTREDRTIVLTGSVDEELRVNIEDMPRVGLSPDEGYRMGDWEEEPPLYVINEEGETTSGEPITEDATYTYVYAEGEAAEENSVTVTFKVENGRWDDDGTNEERSVTLTGRTPMLDADSIPDAGDSPDEGYGMGAWEDEPPLDDIIMADAVFTYVYMPIGAEETAEEPAEEAPEAEQPEEEEAAEPEAEAVTEAEQPPVFEQPSEEAPEAEQTEEAETTEPEAEAVTEAEQPPVFEQPPEDTPEAEQPEEAETAEPEAETTAETEEPPVFEQPAEDTPEAEQSEEAETAEPETEELPVFEQPAEEETEAEQPEEAKTAEPEAETTAETEEPPVLEQPAEEAPEAEQPAEAEPAEEKQEEPAASYTVTFDGGGADGEMEPVQTAGGSQYVLPDAGYSLEGGTFDSWEISGNGETFVVKAGEPITVTGDVTATALWQFDEGAVTEETGTEPAEGAAEDAEGAPEEELDLSEGVSLEESAGEEIVVDAESGDEIELESASEEAAEPAAEGPSEIGSVFGGAGIPALIGAIVLILAAAGIAFTRKKKK